MCGIFGWIVPGSTAPADEILRGLTDRLAHRGPDGSGYWSGHLASGSHQIGFGHRRLAIVDLTDAGAQPMWGPQQRSIVTFNGEIYNFIELRQELEEAGYLFHSHSDTEVLLNAYDHWGLDCLQRLRGMFAFALYDLVRQQVVLGRDPFGKKPLLLHQKHGKLVFSSEIEPILHFPGFEKRLNTSVFQDLLLNRYVPGPSTLFDDIVKLPPGCFATWKDGDLKIERYFQPPLATERSDLTRMEEAADAFGATFDEAVRIRMRSDAPYGAFLSGGIDSSAVVGAMSRHSSRAVRTFSVGFEEEAYSELPYANTVAHHLGTDHMPITITPAAFFAEWEKATQHRGAPVTEPADLAISIMSQAAFSSVRMVMTGEGADEFFGGYPKHRAEVWIGRWQRLMPAISDKMLPAISRILPYGAHRAKVLLRVMGERDAATRLQTWFGGISRKTAMQLLGRDARQPIAEPYPFSLDDPSALRRILFFDQTSWLPDNLLERGDRMMMRGSIEGRMPFLDVELAKIAARMPDRFLTSPMQGKLVLRHAMRDILPSEILSRPKKGFPIPIDKWFREDFHQSLEQLIAEPHSRVRKVLDADIIDRLMQEHMSRAHNHGRTLWSIASLELFLKVFDLDPHLES